VVVRKRLPRRRARKQQGRLNVRQRIARFVRALFSSGPPESNDQWDLPPGGVGVREPRRPRYPSSSGAVALELPPEETRDVWAVGDDDRD
jgi:hypothetical protein